MILPEELFSLALARAPGIGPAKFSRLIASFGSSEAVFSASSQKIRSVISATNALSHYLAKGPDVDFLATDLKWLEHENHRLLISGAADYPKLLADIPDPPPVLYVSGDYTLLHHPQIAVVGSRNPSTTGKEIAYEFSRNLAANGFTITSGMAKGIDAESHRGALDATGNTVAVTGCGLDIVYPTNMVPLAVRIAESGVLISEFPIGTPPDRKNFPRRNRIISGLSLGTLVVEASLKSGSLITARLANEQGREVFAIPGSINNPLSKGCHALIKQGAKLVESSADIGKELAPQITFEEKDFLGEKPLKKPSPNQKESEILNHLGYDPTSIDVLINRSGLTAATVSTILLQLELDGFVTQEPGGNYIRKRR